MMAVCGCEIDHPLVDINKYDDGSFDKLFEECKAEAEDQDDTLAFKLAEKKIVLALVLRLGNPCRPKRSNGEAFFMSADDLAMRETKKKRDPRSGHGFFAKKTERSNGAAFFKSTDDLAMRVTKKKRDPRSGHGFFAKKTQSDEHDNQQGAEAKSPSSTGGTSTDQFANPISMYHDGFYHRFGHTTSTSTSDQEDDDHKKARKNEEKKQSRSRKRRFKGAAANEDEDGEERSKKKKKIYTVKRVDYSKLQGVPNFSEEVRARIGQEGAKDFKLRITKQLFNTDMNEHHDRFSMPVRQILECGDLLNEEEKAIVCDKDANGLEVKLIELGLGKDKYKQVENDLRMKEWNMNSFSYALRSGWRGVLRRNKGKALKENHIVQVYSFRSCHGKLGFVLIKVGDDANGFFREGPFVSRPEVDDEEDATELPTVDNPCGANT